MTRRFPLWLTGFILLTGCRAEQTNGLSGGAIAAAGFLTLILLLLIIWLVYQAERRWQLLQMIRPSRWLRKVPRFREAKGLERQINTLTQTFKRFQKFIPGLKNVDLPQIPGKSGKHGRSRSAIVPDVKKLQKSGKKLSGVVLPAAAERETVTEPVTETEETAVPVAPATPPPTEPDKPETAAAVPPAIGQPTGQAHPADDRDLTGSQFGRYRIDAQVIRNSQQTIYQGMDCNLGRPVRIYQIPLPPTGNISQFQESIQTIARISHPAIALVHDTFIQETAVLIVYEHTATQSSADFLAHMQAQGTPISLPHLLALAAQVAEGMAAAHKVGIVHGRLHPDHIFIAPATNDIPWQAKITGFGLAHLLPAQQHPYQAPEQAQGKTDTCSDIFALGAVLYRWVTGQSPTGETTPTQLRPGLPPEVEQVILRAMAANPSERYADAGEMAAALRALSRQLALLHEQEQLVQQTQPAANPVLYILCAGERPRAVPLTKEKLFVGSGLDNEVYLPSRAVEPCHAQLQKSLLGWQVTDLGSASGSFVAGARLLPQVGEEWDERQPLVIGPYTLMWAVGEGLPSGWLEKAGLPQGTAVPTDEAARATAVSLQLTPSSAEVNPGDTATFSLFLRNNSAQVDHFHVRVGGVPAGWLLISGNDVQLMPGDGYTLLLTVTPPLDHTAAAGDYPLQVWVSPKTNPTQAAQAEALLTVRPFTRVTGTLEPAKIRNKGTACLTLTNQGNVATAVSVLPVDNGEEAVRVSLPEPVTLSPGEVVTIEIPVRGKRPFLGSRRLLPFSLKTVADGDELLHNSQLELRPYLPAWVIPLFAFLFLIALFLFNYRQNQAQLAQTNAIATQMAAPTPRPPIPRTTPTPIPFPATCAEIKTNQPDAADGAYTLYIQHNQSLPVTIYCADMDGTPTAYLPLPQDENSNYATARYPAHELTTRFERVRIDMRTLVIDPTDRTFTVTTGSLPDNLAEPYYNDFGSALGCRSESGADVVGRANINLQGTGFALAETAVFLVEGQDVSPNSGVTINEARTVVEMQVSGLCGWIRPFNGIPLVYTGAN